MKPIKSVIDENIELRAKIAKLEGDIVKLTENTEKLGFSSSLPFGYVEEITIHDFDVMKIHRIAFTSECARSLVIKRGEMGRQIIYNNVSCEAFVDPGALFPKDCNPILYPSMPLRLLIENVSNSMVCVRGWLGVERVKL